MHITIEIKCPHCQSRSITRNGKKYNGTQNYRCSRCGHQFVDDREKTYSGCLFRTVQTIKMMRVRGMGIRDISTVLNASVGKVLKSLKSGTDTIKPKQAYYDRLEADEFWTYAGRKEHKVWLVYAYHCETGKLWGMYGFGERGQRDNRRWERFISAFKGDGHPAGNGMRWG
jgi:transposase-like protein